MELFSFKNDIIEIGYDPYGMKEWKQGMKYVFTKDMTHIFINRKPEFLHCNTEIFELLQDFNVTETVNKKVSDWKSGRLYFDSRINAEAFIHRLNEFIETNPEYLLESLEMEMEKDPFFMTARDWLNNSGLDDVNIYDCISLAELLKAQEAEILNRLGKETDPLLDNIESKVSKIFKELKELI